MAQAGRSDTDVQLPAPQMKDRKQKVAIPFLDSRSRETAGVSLARSTTSTLMLASSKLIDAVRIVTVASISPTPQLGVVLQPLQPTPKIKIIARRQILATVLAAAEMPMAEVIPHP